MPKWVVIENTPGYLPDNDNPFETTDYDEALQEAQTLVKAICDEYVDSCMEDEGIVGQFYTLHDKTSDFWRVVFNDPHKLDRVVEIMEVPFDV